MGPFQRLRVSAIKNGKKMSPFSGEIPSDLRMITKRAMSYDQIEDVLIGFYNNLEENIDTYVELNNELISLSYDKTVQEEINVYYEIVESLVVLRRLSFKNHESEHFLMLFGNKFSIDFNQKTLSIVNNPSNKIWSLLLEQESEYSSFNIVYPKNEDSYLNKQFDPLNLEVHISLSDFNKFSKILPQHLSTHFIHETNVPMDLKNIVPNDFIISIVTSTRLNSYDLFFKLYKDNIPLTYDHAIFECINKLRNCLTKPQYLDTLRQVFIDFLIVIFTNDFTDYDEAFLKESLQNSDFERLSSNDLDFILFTLLEIKDLIISQHRSHVYFDNVHYVVETDYYREILIFLNLWKIFPDLIWHDDPQFHVTIHHRVFYKELVALQSAFSDLAVKLLWDNKQVETISLSADLIIKEGQNWFELHPSLKSGDNKISQEILNDLVKTQGIKIDDNKVTILDPKSMVLLDQFVETFSQLETSPVNKNDFVKLSQLQIFDILNLKKWGASIKIPEKFNYLWKILSDFKEIPEQPIPEKLNGKLRHYQAESLSWLSFLYACGFGACLADDMGLGKTVQTISFLASIYEKRISIQREAVQGPFLIVVPPSLKYVWQSELDKFYPYFKYIDFSKEDINKDLAEYDIVITTYDMIRRHNDYFNKYSFSVGVFDEAQMIKNLFSGRSAAVRKLDIDFKLTLTGTPIENHLGEFFSIIDFTIPGLLKSYKHFQKSAKKQLEDNDLSYIVQKTKPFILRRTKSEILTELPEKTEQNIFLEMSPKQKRYYSKIADSVKKNVHQAYQTKSASQASFIALTAILRLRQVCITPQLIDPEFSEQMPKLDYLVEQLHELYDEGHSAIIFSQFTTYLDIVEDVLRKAGLPIIKMDGRTSQQKRKELIKSFQESDTTMFFIISLKTGGVGLNLTKASYVFHLDPWWNPSVEDQASSRVHRIGQTQKVFISKLIMKYSIEEKILELKKTKQQLTDLLLNNKAAKQQGFSLTKADFDFLLE